MTERNMAPDLIPPPEIERDIIDVARRNQSDSCRGYDLLNPARPDPPEFLVIHKEQSPPNSTVGSPGGYFTGTCVPALTDLEVNAVTGHAKRFVDRGTRIAGWANGKLSAPYGDALKYMNWKADQPGGFWANLINIAGEACEITGYFPTWPVTLDTDVGPEAQAFLVHWFAWRAQQYGISGADFPIIPREMERSYVTWHQEWTIGTGKICPGPKVMNMTSALIDRAAKMLDSYQLAQPAKPDDVYAPVTLPEWWTAQLTERKPSDQPFAGATAYVLQRNFRAEVATPRRSQPDLHADPSAPKVKQGEKITVERQWRDPDSHRLWMIEETGHWVLASKFTPKVAAIAPR